VSHVIKDANVVDSDEWTKSNTKPVPTDSCSSFVKINSRFL